jgi:hypothetical protein
MSSSAQGLYQLGQIIEKGFEKGRFGTSNASRKIKRLLPMASRGNSLEN